MAVEKLVFSNFSELFLCKTHTHTHKYKHQIANHNIKQKISEEKRKSKQITKTQKIYKITIKFTFCGPSTTGHGAYLEMWFNLTNESPLEKTNFSCKQRSTGDGFLVRNGSPCPLPPLSIRISLNLCSASACVRACVLSQQNLCRPCVCCHSLCILLCLESMFSLVSSIPSGSYNLPTHTSAGLPDLWGSSLMQTFHLGLQNILLSAHCPVVTF